MGLASYIFFTEFKRFQGLFKNRMNPISSFLIVKREVNFVHRLTASTTIHFLTCFEL